MNQFLIETNNILLKHPKLKKYIEILLGYWEEHPTQLGHGFYHVLKVAVEAYSIGVKNGFDNPEDLFIGGLFHDIYRPETGLSSKEDQVVCAKVFSQLVAKIGAPSRLVDSVTQAIKSSNEWIDTPKPPLFLLYLSVADKIAHDTTMVYGYAWASNKYAREYKLAMSYTNHLQSLSQFVKYQQQSWNLFIKHPVIGTEKAIISYLGIYETLATNYRNDPKGIKYNETLNEFAKKARDHEYESLKRFRTETQIKKLMKFFY